MIDTFTDFLYMRYDFGGLYACIDFFMDFDGFFIIILLDGDIMIMI